MISTNLKIEFFGWIGVLLIGYGLYLCSIITCLIYAGCFFSLLAIVEALKLEKEKDARK